MRESGSVDHHSGLTMEGEFVGGGALCFIGTKSMNKATVQGGGGCVLLSFPPFLLFEEERKPGRERERERKRRRSRRRWYFREDIAEAVGSFWRRLLAGSTLPATINILNRVSNCRCRRSGKKPKIVDVRCGIGGGLKIFICLNQPFPDGTFDSVIGVEFLQICLVDDLMELYSGLHLERGILKEFFGSLLHCFKESPQPSFEFPEPETQDLDLFTKNPCLL
ncbi:hypothetical protein L1987_23307 [Smallanthus sonchifolius]|uniref:Uncharacterized protein n=1 Tax=Smallanthus sonchifolius TaxID=185202 RepID=A0ACB9IJ15_9ASTR|nr:hypothetical protein L1987_23307 [Smallanthus sonchifolius]